MNFVIDLDRYAESMKGMIGHVTNIVGGKRIVKSISNAVHNVTVKSGGNEITLFLQESDLYILGFRNATGSFRFNDHPGGGANTLPIGSSYTKAQCISVLRGDDVKRLAQSKAQIISAVIGIAGYVQGQDVGSAMKINLGIMAYVISESLRFKNIFHRMCGILQGVGSFTFAEFEEYVKNWQEISNGPLGARTVLSTYQS